MLDGVFWIARTGSPWRDLPEEFGKWSSVYRQFRRWTLAGLWETILEALNEAAGELDHPPDRLHMIDSTVVRAHQHAAGAIEQPAVWKFC
ncbi:Transposase [Jannaschia seosinensis]|uniref:Transposase n=1 Tax=Jannaschia seosinensis TaxID=313367 RepID=A0A0M7B558_9RHOB|nr:Transposase [Jannaschia seosinensis]